jgi:hypothetical protein
MIEFDLAVEASEFFRGFRVHLNRRPEGVTETGEMEHLLAGRDDELHPLPPGDLQQRIPETLRIAVRSRHGVELREGSRALRERVDETLGTDHAMTGA